MTRASATIPVPEQSAEEMHMTQELYTSQQLCSYLKLSQRTIYRYMRLGMPHEKLNSRLARFRLKDVMGWLKDRGLRSR
jgi:excisionase family DNA binding protein